MQSFSRGIHFDASQLVKIEVVLEKIKKVGIKSLKTVLLRGSTAILKDAKLNVPVWSGALKSTGRIIKPKVTATKTRFDYIVTFGGIQGKGTNPRTGKAISKFVNYAFLIEDTHPSKSKYLERAYAKHWPKLAKELEQTVTKNLRKIRG